jgi:hypothetical protein
MMCTGDEGLKPCPFCKKNAVFIGVHDDEGNFHGLLGCDYEAEPWSGLSYALHHEGWGDCILCTDDAELTMGGVLFDTAEEAIEALNRRVPQTVVNQHGSNCTHISNCGTLNLNL